jgi:site-specific DNA-adenine methylase
MRNNLIKFHDNIQNISFSTKHFKYFDYSFLTKEDMLYADPPYLITNGSYNDGKRGFEGWGEQDDLALFDILDKLNDRNIHFALSNVIEHKGQQNALLNEWRQRYYTHFLNANYSNSNYQCKEKETRTVEVLITNY